MKVLGRITVFPIMPSRIARLYELAYNLWWSWHPEARALYRTLEPDVWDQVGHNPVRFLSAVPPKLLEEAAQRDDYLQAYDSVLRDFDAYMHPRPGDTWFARTYPELTHRVIAYFSAEFGLHESLPIYSGGLGILSGDHCKEASDLGLPFVGVGFCTHKAISASISLVMVCKKHFMTNCTSPRRPLFRPQIQMGPKS